jgi:YhgE/Pip-like protein
MKLFKQKMVLISPLIVLLVGFIFCLTFASSINPTPNHLPVAVYVGDQGVELPEQGKTIIGANMVKQIMESSKKLDSQPIKWVEVTNIEEVNRGLDDQDFYAALVFPEDFSRKVSSLQSPSPASAEVQLLINQGMNVSGANMASQVLTNIVDTMSQQLRTQTLSGFDKRGGTLTTAQAAALAVPIAKKVENIHPIGTNSAGGNAPISLIQPLWMSMLLGSVIVFIMKQKLVFRNRADKIAGILAQLLTGAVLALVAGFGIVWIASGMLGLNIPQFTESALFIAISYFCFFAMISAVTSWLGLGGVGIFALLFFFGAPLLAMAPELMPTFSHDWLYSWLPMRFSAEGLRQLFYFGHGLEMNQPVKVLLGIGAVSLVLLFASVLKPSKNAEAVRETARSAAELS